MYCVLYEPPQKVCSFLKWSNLIGPISKHTLPFFLVPNVKYEERGRTTNFSDRLLNILLVYVLPSFVISAPLCSKVGPFSST